MTSTPLLQLPEGVVTHQWEKPERQLCKWWIISGCPSYPSLIASTDHHDYFIKCRGHWCLCSCCSAWWHAEMTQMEVAQPWTTPQF